MNIGQAFPSSFLKAADLNGKSWKMQIKSCEVEEIGDDRKPVLHFEKTEKGVVLNKTNAMAIATIYGEDTDHWIGRAVEVFPDTTMYQGRPTPCIRIKPVLQQGNGHLGQPAPAPAPAPRDPEPQYGPGSLSVMDDGDIPFAPSFV